MKKPNSSKWHLEINVNGVWKSNSRHTSCDAAKTRARNITGWHGNPQWRIVAPNGETFVVGVKRNGKMAWAEV